MGLSTVGPIYKSFILGREGNPGRRDMRDYGVFITGKTVYDMPVRQVEMVTIPGRNGTLLRDMGRWENIEVVYHAGIAADSQEEFATAMQNLRHALTGRYATYQYIYDDYNPDEFRLGVFKGGLEVEPDVYGKTGEFDIVFDCKPQRFLKSGENFVSRQSGGSISNTRSQYTHPLLRFKMTSATGNITIARGNTTIGAISISNAPLDTLIYIDCETGEAYNLTTLESYNQYVDLGAELPYLTGGSNTITYSASVTDFEIMPRWWIL